MYLIHASSHTRINVVQMMPSTPLDISFSNILNSPKHMHECPLLSFAQPLTPLSPRSYWREWKQWKSTLLSSNGATLFSPPDQVPFPVSDHKHRCSPRMHQFSITLHTWFADDSAILSQLFAHNNTDTCFSEVNQFTEWCTDNFVELNTPKN